MMPIMIFGFVGSRWYFSAKRVMDTINERFSIDGKITIRDNVVVIPNCLALNGVIDVVSQEAIDSMETLGVCYSVGDVINLSIINEWGAIRQVPVPAKLPKFINAENIYQACAKVMRKTFSVELNIDGDNAYTILDTKDVFLATAAYKQPYRYNHKSYSEYTKHELSSIAIKYNGEVLFSRSIYYLKSEGLK